ncbi:hypothetical protein [Caballeronia sp. Lep1P3]|uniref:hypothetical protein n=1 Tax=Caballeronia sp. Lep1P3 TaxID=2878150 RepID=UPI001FD5DC14|nr:hypothetical protein [Caballeronia sp. Lep1P3]
MDEGGHGEQVDQRMARFYLRAAEIGAAGDDVVGLAVMCAAGALPVSLTWGHSSAVLK